jgi:hypothetical protein
MTDLVSKAERPYGCRSPEVFAGTDCLPNTNNRCTWCGRHIPRERYRTSEELGRYHAYQSDPAHAGTDPVEWEAGGPDYWESDPDGRKTA